uniref:DNA (cytosine-5-)-methyltransferase n=1 Tax=Tigriopus japonicus TaxID=158387 RepID=A0A0N9BE14_TIGJA|nr:DNA (cytosine-5)-methyltransferase [Tigriopus japonicus]
MMENLNPNVPSNHFQDMDEAGEDLKDPSYGPNSRSKSKRKSVSKALNKPTKKVKINRCSQCLQDLDDVSTLYLYQGHPANSVEEVIAITNEALTLELCLDEEDMMEDPRQYYRLTDFQFYDREGHLVPLDRGVIENDKEVMFSGYLKVITDDSPLIENGVAVFDGGPLEQWWAYGFEKGSQLTIGVSTESGHYCLTAPSEQYKPLFQEVLFKGHLAKLVVEFLALCNENRIPMDYEDLLASLEGESHPELPYPVNEDALIRHADFILSQVQSFEEAADSSEEIFMMNSECIAALIERAGLRPKNIRKMMRPNKVASVAKKLVLSKATTTPLVRSVFERLFGDQFAGEDVSQKTQRKRRCHVCEACTAADCGECSQCKNMTKFGGTGKGKQACDKRTCQNMVEILAEDVEAVVSEEDTSISEEPTEQHAHKKKATIRMKTKNKIEFVGVGEKVRNRSYFSEVRVNGETYRCGDFAHFLVPETRSGYSLQIRRIESLFQSKNGGSSNAHVQWFQRSEDTCLGDFSRKGEIFQVLYCEDVTLDDLYGKLRVDFWHFPQNMLEIGGTEDALVQPPKSEFYYRMRYDAELARFEAAIPVEKTKDSYAFESCLICPWREKIDERSTLQALKPLDEEPDDNGRFMFKSLNAFGETIQIDEAVFFKPTEVKAVREKVDSMDERFLDEVKYPEYYRKTGYVKGSNVNTPKPFNIGIVQEISAQDHEGLKKVKVVVRRLYRPEDTNLKQSEVLATDYNLLYWSDDLNTVDGSSIQGKCTVRPESADVIGRYSFYFILAYNRSKKSFEELPPQAEMYGKVKGKGKGKSSVKSTTSKEVKMEESTKEDVKVRPLRCLDVFAGCGGLSHGLHEAGIAQSDWAIEVYEPAAKAFKANNPDAVVFTDDCNVLLRKIINGEKFNEKKQPLPRKGEVEMLIGGPPCQGYSGMNRFSHGAYSSLKNSLVSSYLSYLDYFRPKYFILENVRNFASFQKSAVLRLCQSVILQMGYSCTFAVLQCGSYGVPQTRRRLILLASAPGYELPEFPEPQHVFTNTPLSVQIDNTVYRSNIRWTDSAPFRTVTVNDTTSDLPHIQSGQQDLIMKYEDEPQTPFQRQMRAHVEELRDHICKKLVPVVEARMTYIPTEPGADWRCLPNIVIKLKDGTFCEKLKYPYEDFKQGRSKLGAKRGVCTCLNGAPNKKCDPNAKQTNNTLIPWCLPHTANRHNHWAGLYGRLEAQGYFSTTVTNPEPMGKQGRVLHPEQHRVVSVRECARSQGFPDSYIFVGNLIEKHRQVGNAVPPPLGRHLGLEIRKALTQSKVYLSGKVDTKQEIVKTDG